MNERLARPRIALALSGGGFRASVFHLGTLRRIAEAGWLSKVDVLSTVSGGSVVGAFAALRWKQVLDSGADWASLDRHVVQPFLALVTQRNFLLSWTCRLPLALLRRVFDSTYTRTKLAAELWGSTFFENKRCDELPEHPCLVLNAGSLVSMRAWRFTRDGMGDSRHGHAAWNSQALPIGECVGASAGFPPVFSPTRIQREGYRFSAPIYGEPALPEFPVIPLTDGGAYDNLGTEAVTKPTRLPGTTHELPVCEFLVVSDAGYPAQHRFRNSGLPVLSEALLLFRVDDMAREQVSALRRRDLINRFSDPNHSLKGLLVSLGSNVDRIPGDGGTEYSAMVGKDYRIPPDLLALIQKVRTHLDRFSPVECEALMYHAYAMTDAFLWAHREQQPEAYRVSSKSSPKWKINFTAGKIAEWRRGLAESHRRRIVRPR